MTRIKNRIAIALPLAFLVFAALATEAARRW